MVPPPDQLRRFELEAQAGAALNHPNIVSIFRVGEYEGSPYYIVTEPLQGETLRAAASCPMRLRETINVGTNIAHGLAAAHNAGIVHRDLKPENIRIIVKNANHDSRQAQRTCAPLHSREASSNKFLFV